MSEKNCPRCKVTQPVENFHKCKNYKSGYASWCKSCCLEAHAARYSNDSSKDKARARAWYQAIGKERQKMRRAQSKPVTLPKDPDKKFCPACQITKTKTEFRRCVGRYDGLQGNCKACQQVSHLRKQQERRQLIEAGLLIRPTKKRCPACGTTKPAKSFSLSVNTKDGLFRSCKACSKSTLKQWEKTMPEKSRLVKRGHCAKRRAMQKKATVGKVSYYEIAMRDDYTCHLCNRRVPVGEIFHFDHVIPLSKGGTHTNENIKIACEFCNLSKGAKLIKAG